MSDSPHYYCLLTDAGAALEAQALAECKPIRLTHIAVGDGNGIVPTPDVSATALVHEVHRRAIDARTQSEDDPNIAILHATIPAEEGGWWIRELGVYAESLDEGGEPVLYAYGNHAPYYKMLPASGQMTSHELQVPVITSSAANIEIVIPDTGYASATQFRLLSALVESLRDRRQASWTLESTVEDGGDLILPEGITYEAGGEMEELIETFSQLAYALVIALGLVYFVLASQFESFIMPVIIMTILPISLLGSLFPLPFTGNKISMLAFIGIIMLAGTVVNSSIVLIDYTNIRRGRGEDKNTAILNACPRRVRPVLMTTLTTILGLVPMVFSNGEGAEMMQPMAIVMIAGMILSTIVTLLFTPVYYSLIDSLTEFVKNRLSRHTPHNPTQPEGSQT